jgi:hypothetical protein
LLAGRSPPAAQGPCQQSTVQERQQHQDRRRQSRRAREGNPPVKGDCSAQPRMRRGDRAAVRRPVRRHLLMAPRPDRRALERLCGTRGPMTARAARGHRPAAGATGEGGSSRLLPFFCCFNVCVVETVHVDFIAVFSLPHHPPFAVHTPAFQAGFGVARWALAPCCAGAMPAINSAGKAAAPRQEETEQEGERGQSPRQRGLFGAAQDAEGRPGCSASSGPTSSVDGAEAGQTCT